MIIKKIYKRSCACLATVHTAQHITAIWDLLCTLTDTLSHQAILLFIFLIKSSIWPEQHLSRSNVLTASVVPSSFYKCVRRPDGSAVCFKVVGYLSDYFGVRALVVKRSVCFFFVFHLQKKKKKEKQLDKMRLRRDLEEI